MKKLLEQFANMKMENKLLLLALLCGLFAAIMGYGFITLKEANMMKSLEPVKVFVAAKYITPKTQINEDMVKEAQIPAKFLTSAHVSDFKKLKGRMSMVPFIEGEPILLNKVSEKADELSAAVPSGLRAIAISVDEESSVGYMIKPGDMVDTLLTYEQGEGKSTHNVTAIILQAVQVVAVGTELRETEEGKKYNSLTLAVTPEEAELITFASSRGRISFILRPIGDNTREQIKLTAFDDLLKQIKANEKKDEFVEKSIPLKQEEIKTR
ncbi:MAG: Flp pilus assembly protein CpaB [bacterium]